MPFKPIDLKGINLGNIGLKNIFIHDFYFYVIYFYFFPTVICYIKAYEVSPPSPYSSYYHLGSFALLKLISSVPSVKHTSIILFLSQQRIQVKFKGVFLLSNAALIIVVIPKAQHHITGLTIGEINLIFSVTI